MWSMPRVFPSMSFCNRETWDEWKVGVFSSSRLGQPGESSTFLCSFRLWPLNRSLPPPRHLTSSTLQQNSTQLFFPVRRSNFECFFVNVFQFRIAKINSINRLRIYIYFPQKSMLNWVLNLIRSWKRHPKFYFPNQLQKWAGKELLSITKTFITSTLISFNKENFYNKFSSTLMSFYWSTFSLRTQEIFL